MISPIFSRVFFRKILLVTLLPVQSPDFTFEVLFMYRGDGETTAAPIYRAAQLSFDSVIDACYVYITTHNKLVFNSKAHFRC